MTKRKSEHEKSTLTEEKNLDDALYSPSYPHGFKVGTETRRPKATNVWVSFSKNGNHEPFQIDFDWPSKCLHNELCDETGSSINKSVLLQEASNKSIDLNKSLRSQGIKNNSKLRFTTCYND